MDLPLVTRPLIAAVLGAALSVSTPALAAPSPLDRAETHLDAEEFAPAGDAFVEYYDGLSADRRIGATGEFVVMKAASAYGRAWERESKVEHLQSSKALLERFIGAVEAEHGSDSELLKRPKAELGRVEALIAEATPPEPEPEPIAEPEPEPEPEPIAEPEPEPEPEPREAVTVEPEPGPQDTGRDKLGLGLLIGGAGLTAGGVGFLISGLVLRSRAESRVDEKGGRDAFDSTAIDDWFDQVDRWRYASIGVGAAAAAIGIGGMVWGGIRLKRHKQQAYLRISPRLGATRVGVTVGGRF